MSNLILKSPDRQLFGITVRQREDGMLSLSDLQTAYDSAAKEFGWGEKRVLNAFDSFQNIERIYYILEKAKKVNSGYSEFTEIVRKSPSKHLKALNVWKTTRKEGVFVDPYIWVSIAMWMNPKIYAEVVFWLTDFLIFNRMEAKVQYRPMTDAIQKHLLPKMDKEEQQYVYANEANMINEVVFGQKGKGLRDTATAEQLREIETLERMNTYLIERGVYCRKQRRAELMKFKK